MYSSPVYLFEYGFYQSPHHMHEIAPVILQVMCMLSILATGAAQTGCSEMVWRFLRSVSFFVAHILMAMSRCTYEYTGKTETCQDSRTVFIVLPTVISAISCIQIERSSNWNWVKLSQDDQKKRKPNSIKLLNNLKFVITRIFFCYFIW